MHCISFCTYITFVVRVIKKKENKIVKTVTIIHYKHDSVDNKGKFKSITLQGAIKAMDGKGGYTKEYLESKTADEIANIWNCYIHTAFID